MSITQVNKYILITKTNWESLTLAEKEECFDLANNKELNPRKFNGVDEYLFEITEAKIALCKLKDFPIFEGTEIRAKQVAKSLEG